uniref:Uncharacterized protein n=1 Tax=Arundo donax TaxID=35708 RepID=A0A0A9FZZ2_ARUDO
MLQEQKLPHERACKLSSQQKQVKLLAQLRALTVGHASVP